MTEIARSAPTWWANIWLAGDERTAREACRAFCFAEGLCVTVTPTCFVYTGGAEDGVCVRLLNYPRFPSTPTALAEKATRLALHLRDVMHQWSVLVETPTETTWLTRREERANG